MEDMAEDEPYGVSESVVSEYTGQVDEYEKLDDEYEFQYAVSTVNDRLVEILIYHRLHFWRCMQQALKGIPKSVASLRRMAEEAPDIGELIWIILSSGKDIGRMIEMEEVKGCDSMKALDVMERLSDLSMKQLVLFYELCKAGVVRFDMGNPVHAVLLRQMYMMMQRNMDMEARIQDSLLPVCVQNWKFILLN